MSAIDSALEAIRADDRATLQELIANDPGLATATDTQGVPLAMTALYHGKRDLAALIAAALEKPDIAIAAALGRRDWLAARLAEAPDALASVGADGFTPLHLAAFFGGAEAVRFLLEKGADPHAISQNPMKLRPLNSAVAGGQAASVRALLAAGAAVDAPQQQDITPLMGAAAGGLRDIVAILLAAGADRTLKSADGNTAASYAEQRGHQHLQELLQT